MRTSRLPPCDAIGPDGRRIVIHPATSDDRVGDLASALSIPVAEPLHIDGRPCIPRLPLVRSGLRVGSIISTGPDRPPPPERHGSGSLALGVVAGPACAPAVRLGAGRHVIGRAATADIRVDDPGLELHHGVIVVAADGRAVFSQLTGRVPARIDGRPCLPCQPLEAGQTLLLGRSRIRIEPWSETTAAGGNIVPSDHDPWRQTIRRSPARDDRFVAPELAVPEEPPAHRGPPAIGLVGAAMAVAGAGLMAAVFGQLLFALFAAVGAVATLATWMIGSLGALRQRRRATADHRRRLAVFVARLGELHDDVERHHRENHLSIGDALSIVGAGARLWERRPQGEPLRATIGPGTCRWQTAIGDDQRRTLQPAILAALERCERMDGVAVPLTLPPASAVALRGDTATVTALGRALIVQLAALYGPCDWRLLVVTERPEEWEWVDWLPHTRWTGGVVRADDLGRWRDAATVTDGPDGPQTVVVTDAAGLLAARTGLLRRFLTATEAACIVLTFDRPVPAVCQRVLDVGSTGSARWGHGGDTTGKEARKETRKEARKETGKETWDEGGASGIDVAGLSRSTAAEAARRLAPLVDPEGGDAASTLPTAVRFGDLEAFESDVAVHLDPHGGDGDGHAAASVVRRWRSHGDDPPLAATIGVSADGVVDIDLVRDGPHGLIAGTTGSGKSELLRTLVIALAVNVGPDHLTFVLVDFKGGSTFDACARLPHTVGLVTDLDGGLATRALVSLEAEVRRRERLLRTMGAADLSDYRRLPGTDPLPRLVVVIDEFASMAREFPDVLAALVGVAQRGRSLGLHLLLATQRPAGVVTDDIRANTNLRLALRLNDAADAGDVVGDDAPAMFPRSIAGRAAMRLGPEELVVFQVASCSEPLLVDSGRLRVAPPGVSDVPLGDSAGPSELVRAVDLVRAAAVAAGVTPPRPAWLPPLPPIVSPDDLEPGAIGIIDDPANQGRRPLRWDHEAGNLLLVGGLGSGTTTTAVALVAAFVGTLVPLGRQVYVIDGRGDPAWDVVADRVDECGAVIRLHEGERLLRLLTRLTAAIDHRGSAEADIMLVVDGLGPTRLALASPELGDAAVRLERVLQDGPSARIFVCATTDGASGGSSMPSVDRWIFRLDDPAASTATGHRGPAAEAGVPGRLRLAGSGLEAQVAFDPKAIGNRSSTGRRAPAVDVLPSQVCADALTTAPPEAPLDVMSLLVGLASSDLAAAHLLVPAGDHVLVVGAARTGKSTALRQLAASWSERHRAGEVIVVDRRGAPGAVDLSTRAAHDPPLLLVVDDADRVADVTGAFADVIAGRHPGVTILASARLEAARVAYGHWVRDVARSHCGLVLTAAGEIDGELLGALLPRRTPMGPRPGLAWMVDERGHQLVQVAGRMSG